MYGTIRMHQEREYPTRVLRHRAQQPGFRRLARAFGGHGETVEKTADFAPAFERALAAGKPAIIEVKIDPEALTSRITLTKLREQSLAGALSDVQSMQSSAPLRGGEGHQVANALRAEALRRASPL